MPRLLCSSLALLGTACGREVVALPSGELLDRDWLVVVLTSEAGEARRVGGVFDLRLEEPRSVDAELGEAIVLAAFEEAALPFAPVGGIRAEISAAPLEPIYHHVPPELTAEMAWPPGARVLGFDLEGRTTSVDAEALRASVTLRFAYAQDPPLHYVPFADTARYLDALEPILELEGARFFENRIIQKLVAVDETRVVALMPTVLIVFDRDQDLPPQTRSPGRPSRWFPNTALRPFAGTFQDLALFPHPEIDGSRELIVVGGIAERGGHVWSFRLSGEGLRFDRELEVRSSTTVPRLDHVAIDAEGSVLVAGANLFLASRTRSSTVFESTNSLIEFAQLREPEPEESFELTLLATSTDPTRPHIVGLDRGLVVAGRADPARWEVLTDLRAVRGTEFKLHVESYVDGPVGEAWVGTRLGGLFRRRLGGAFREMPLIATRELLACGNEALVIEHQIFALALAGDHLFALADDCTAALRIRREDGQVSPILEFGETEAAVTRGPRRHKVARAAGRAYILGGYEGYLGYVSVR